MELKIYQRIDVHRPVMLAAWPGMGNVGLAAIDYLRRELKTELFGEIDISQFVAPDAVTVEDGIAKLPRLPRTAIYYRKYTDLIILEGETQLHGKFGVTLIEQILKFVKEFQVSKIFTGAAFPLPISYEEPSIVYGAATTRSLRDLLFSEYRIKIMERGEISGLNGLLMGYAREIGVPAACLLATMPLYAINMPNPKASRAIVRVIADILGVSLTMTNLDFRVQQMEKEMSELEEKMKEELSPLMKAEGSGGEAPGEVPLYVRQRIERLFREARQDKTKAYRLKKELDKWNLFESYEDRFLDLFKEH